MTQAESYDMIVIGAGISGLSLANHIARSGKKVLVVDAANKVGGCLNTYYKDDFWVEMGAHTFYATYANLIDLIQKNELEQDIVAREKVGMKVFTDKHEKIMSGVNKFELIRSVPNLFFSKRDGKTVKEYFGKIVGRKNYNNVFTRMFSAVIVQNADHFSAEYFLKRRKTKSKEHPKSFILKKGMSSFMEALAAHENIKIQLNTKINQLTKNQEGFEVKSEAGDVFASKDIALAVSPKLASELSKDLNSDLSSVLADYPIQNIESRTVVLPKEKLNFDPVSFIIPLQGPCFSMVTRDVMTHDNMRGFAFHFEENHIGKEEQEKFMTELLCLDSLDAETVEAKHKLPLIKVGHTERMAKIKHLAEETGIYITGNYFNGLSLEDCVERSKQEFERYVGNYK
ncbi:protoporphyrinogen/coproporphyrinogen oxidase [Marinifilum sp. D737]|uniref:protoporphyrinogen/coproporphyrinogen oxidase n=1 Tax=Marinifilum sp. D737 TaxID=2969628 RepID=UPI002276399B|nr:FAD-dependent oxidoreductase [Marinifilum sp. D737]MCY1634218.1 FAD-dependent oxidoreductase [Marinifilum sp. D737]